MHGLPTTLAYFGLVNKCAQLIGHVKLFTPLKVTPQMNPTLCISNIETVPTLCILNVGTVPTLCFLNVGTVVTWCILNIGTVPTFSFSLKIKMVK